MPDFVTALTSVPDDPPWEASKRLATNSNSAIASLLYFGWPKPAVWFCVTRKPSTFSWKVPMLPALPGSSLMIAFERAPGASSVRSTKLRPLSGRSDICRGSTLLATDELVRSMQRRGGADRDVLLERGGHQPHVDDGLLADEELDAGARQRGEAFELGGHAVGADADRQAEAAACLGDGLEAVAARLVDRR